MIFDISIYIEQLSPITVIVQHVLESCSCCCAYMYRSFIDKFSVFDCAKQVVALNIQSFLELPEIMVWRHLKLMATEFVIEFVMKSFLLVSRVS